MSDKRYNFIFSGQILEGRTLEEVKRNLAAVLKTDVDKISQLFSGRRFVVKKHIDYHTAVKYKDAFKRAGAVCEIENLPEDGVTSPPPLPIKNGPEGPNRISAIDTNTFFEPTEIRPKKWWYLVAILLFLVPMISGIGVIIDTVLPTLTGGTELMVPGETIIAIKKPAKYLIWYETSGFAEENNFQNKLFKDFEISIHDMYTGDELKLKSSSFQGKEEYGTIVRHSIAEIEFDSSGEYRIEVTGELPGTDGLLIKRFNFAEMIKGILLAIFLIFTGFIAGPVTALIVFLKRSNAKKKEMRESMSKDKERKWAMFCHIGTFSSMLVPFGNILAPLIIWQLKKKESTFIVDHAKESLNFQITLMIYFFISILLILIIIGFFILFGLVVFSLIVVILAGIKANEGEWYQYPVTIRLIK